MCYISSDRRRNDILPCNTVRGEAEEVKGCSGGSTVNTGSPVYETLMSPHRQLPVGISSSMIMKCGREKVGSFPDRKPACTTAYAISAAARVL